MYVCSQGKAQGQCEDWAVNRGCVLARLPAVSNGLALPVGAALTAAVAPGPRSVTPLTGGAGSGWAAVAGNGTALGRAGCVSICTPDGPHSTAASDKMPPPQEERAEPGLEGSLGSFSRGGPWPESGW